MFLLINIYFTFQHIQSNQLFRSVAYKHLLGDIVMIKRVLIGLCFLLMAGNSMAIEEPKYRVIETSGNFELRVYDPKIIAEVEVTGNLKKASNKGFKLIADYIFGNNTSRNKLDSNEKIAMTVPVTMKQKSEKVAMTAPVTMKQSGKNWNMHFVMPSKFTLATLPKPNNPEVKIRQLEGAKYAVIRFSGFTGKTKTDKKTAELQKWLKSKNIQATGQPELARYNPPWTPPFFRRNEVMIKY